MRSFLVQASSVEKAIEKGWAEAGAPTEFTVKIHDFGEKGFFGITKKQAIISIIYEPQKQTGLASSQQQSSQPQQQRPQPIQRNYDGDTRRHPQHTKRQPHRPTHQHAPQTQASQTHVSQTQVSQTHASQPQTSHIESQTQVSQTQVSQAQVSQQQEILFWNDALVKDVSEWLTDLVKIMNFQVPFNVKINKKNLSFIFDRNVLESRDEERLLFSGLSYLLVQSLKKKYKKKFQGYRLIITSKESNTPRDGNTSREVHDYKQHGEQE